MSLDVVLIVSEPVKKVGTGVFVRENGQTIELTADQVKEKWPNTVVDEYKYHTQTVFAANITHNLNKMAEAADIYHCIWYPMSDAKAIDLIIPLAVGLKKLLDDPARYKKYNPPNEWGNYDTLLNFVKNYLTVCINFPDATVHVDR